MKGAFHTLAINGIRSQIPLILAKNQDNHHGWFGSRSSLFLTNSNPAKPAQFNS